MKQNLYSFSLFLNTYNFPIFKNSRRKTFWVVLIFDGFSIFRIFFSPFYGWVTFPESAEFSMRFWRCLLSKLKFLLQISLTGDGLFGAKSLWANHSIFFFHHLVRSHHSTDLDFFRSTDYRAQSADCLTFFSLSF